MRQFLKVFAQFGIVLSMSGAILAALGLLISLGTSVEHDGAGPSTAILFACLGCGVLCGILFETTEIAQLLERQTQEPLSQKETVNGVISTPIPMGYGI